MDSSFWALFGAQKMETCSERHQEEADGIRDGPSSIRSSSRDVVERYVVILVLGHASGR